MQMGWKLPDAFRLVSSRRAVAAMSDSQLAVLRELDITLAPVASLERT
jgi:hypothetical protein